MSHDPQDLFRVVDAAAVVKLKISDTDGPKVSAPAFRLYCTGAGSRWSLQVRGFLERYDGSQSDQFCYAHATLSAEDLRALAAHATMLAGELAEPEEPPALNPILTARDAAAELRAVGRDPETGPEVVQAIALLLDHVTALERVVNRIASATESALEHRPANAILEDS